MLRALIESCGSEAGSRDVSSLVSELLPILLDKAGDNNTRIRDSSSDTVLWLANRREVNMAAMLPALSRPVKNQNAWRPVFARLQLMMSLIPLFGVSKGGETGFQPEALMKFVGSAFGSANAEVRGQAIKVTLLLYSKVRIYSTWKLHAVSATAQALGLALLYSQCMSQCMSLDMHLKALIWQLSVSGTQHARQDHP